MYSFRPDAADTIALAGVVQAQMAEKAGIDRHHLNKRIKHRTRLRLTTAAKIARAFAELTQISQGEALSQLFEEVADEDSPPATDEQ
jgi:DNA-binding XRE family transcriptional regulator